MNTDVEVVSRRRLVQTAVITTVLATGHFADHVIRGALVVHRGLNPEWNHSGWPFQPEVNPFDLSVVLVYSLLLGGIVLTVRRRVLGGYWLAASVVLTALASFILFALLGALAVMAATAGWTRRATGHW